MGKLSAVLGSALMLFSVLSAAAHADSAKIMKAQHSPPFMGGVIKIASGICPQKRNTRQAPSGRLNSKNPLEKSPENIARGEMLYYKEARPTACGLCHGVRGNGNGKLAPGLEPPPRNFTCSPTMKEISDGQLFWIIGNGSRGTAMPAHKNTLSEKEIWQLIHFIRKFTQ